MKPTGSPADGFSLPANYLGTFWQLKVKTQQKFPLPLGAARFRQAESELGEASGSEQTFN